MKNYIQIQTPADCCGCGACANSCPKGAITMQEDAAGFLFPVVEEEKCIGCGKCVKVCSFKTPHKGENGDAVVYAAAVKDRDILLNSSSGGIFNPLACAVLDKGGAVFGAAWTEQLSLAHICITAKEDLQKLRGSKYVQSDTKDTFRQVKALLADGKKVCYCGTPCQIAGLKAFLGNEQENLLTIDLVCHGVPSMKMLRDDLSAVAGKKFSEIQNVKFRDKRFGWGVKGSLDFGKNRAKYNEGNSPYYYYFLNGEIYRESCYNCRFPAENRQGDITLGDYWGIRSELIEQLGDVNPNEGISCVLVNTEKGKQWLAEITPQLALALSDRKSAEKQNHQLTHASVPLPEHRTLLNGYTENGYAAFRAGYRKHSKDRVVFLLKCIIPAQWKRKIKEMLH